MASSYSWIPLLLASNFFITNVLQYTFKIVNAVFYTIRPSATLGACLLTLGAYNPLTAPNNLLLPLMSAAFFGGSFCFLTNDLFDKEKDLLNEKKRPIATGVLPTTTARLISIAFALIFLGSTWFLGIVPFALSFGFLVIASTYSYVNSKTGILANAIVALMVSGTQWGVALVKPNDLLWVSSLFLFFLTIPREVLLDWLDINGDRLSGKRSFPMERSNSSVRNLILLCLIICTASIYFFALTQLGISLWFFISACLAAWISFFFFLKKSNDFNALLGIRFSHLSFALFILALFSR